VKVLFHANASESIGAGHLMRSLALAQGLAEKGHGILLVTCPESGHGLISPWRALGATVFVESLQRSAAEPAAGGLARAEKAQAEWVVLDGYEFDSAYQRVLKEAGHRVLVIDDMAHLPGYHADILLNQNWNASLLSYRCAPETVMLLGTRYVLLRHEFLQWSGWDREIPRVARHLLVTLGGGGHGAVTTAILNVLRDLDAPDLEVKVIHAASRPGGDPVGEGNPPGRVRLEILPRAEKMADLMAWADMAISGGGSTCWEMAYMGLPNLIIVLADNQEGVAVSLERLGCSIRVGSKEALLPDRLSQVAGALIRDGDKRGLMAEKGRTLVDGLGVQRVVERMMQTEGLEERQPSVQSCGGGSPG
jgi:UDP-2,4-diacetamido-2,4,6-trideoxy-beta-L-altropyranose hydrolase